MYSAFVYSLYMPDLSIAIDKTDLNCSAFYWLSFDFSFLWMVFQFHALFQDIQQLRLCDIWILQLLDQPVLHTSIYVYLLSIANTICQCSARVFIFTFYSYDIFFLNSKQVFSKDVKFLLYQYWGCKDANITHKIS